ncbi:MAG: NUDIX hydrolase [Thermostichus sp. DG02_5_bins_236]
MSLHWLTWAQQLQAIAQNGLTYSQNPFDIERYQKLRQIAAQILAQHTDLEAGAILKGFEQEQGYATPKVDVRAAVFREDQILLVKERIDGCWTLPGGWADVGDSPSEAVEREVWEESGYRAKAVKLLAVYDKSRHEHPAYQDYSYKLFFHCQLTGGSPSTSLETDGVEFFPEDQLPPLSLPRVTPAQVARLFEHYRHPDWPTDFD